MNRQAPPQRSEAPTVASGQGFWDQKTSDTTDSPANCASDQDRAFAVQRARLARAGWSLHAIDDGSGTASYWVSRWGLCRTLPDRHALAKFMQQVGCAS